MQASNSNDEKEIVPEPIQPLGVEEALAELAEIILAFYLQDHPLPYQNGTVSLSTPPTTVIQIDT